LVQTGKGRKIPIILVESAFWAGLLDWFKTTLVSEGTIAADDLNLIQVIDDPQEVVNAIFAHYQSRGFEPSSEEQEILLEL
jgi:predicted Rossmann-fold nucleotide-binding protein